MTTDLDELIREAERSPHPVTCRTCGATYGPPSRRYSRDVFGAWVAYHDGPHTREAR